MSTSVRLHCAIDNYPHAVALKDGRVTSERVRLEFEEVSPITRSFRRMVRTYDFDMCEIALTTLGQAIAFGKKVTGLPVVLMRGFHHGALVCPRDSTLRGPADLRGKRVGVRAFSQTTGVWVRGILRGDYGVDHADITWVTAEDAHVQEYQDPPNVVRAPPGRTLPDMLLSGEVDAAIALGGIDPAQVRTVIPDADAAAADWFRRTGAYPVNHVVCVRNEFLASNDWLAAELMDMFATAQQEARTPPNEARWRAIVGYDVLPYGLEANRRGIELCLEFAAQQGLTPTAYRAENVFAAAGT